jgi:hypothetical protein
MGVYSSSEDRNQMARNPDEPGDSSGDPDRRGILSVQVVRGNEEAMVRGLR